MKFCLPAHGTNSAVIHGHDKTLNQQCMHARSGLPPGDKHLTSFSTGRKFRPVSNFT